MVPLEPAGGRVLKSSGKGRSHRASWSEEMGNWDNCCHSEDFVPKPHSYSMSADHCNQRRLQRWRAGAGLQTVGQIPFVVELRGAQSGSEVCQLRGTPQTIALGEG